MMNQETIHIRKLTTGYPGKGGDQDCSEGH